jgi:5-methylcytosine-specific restriction protein A
MTRATLVHHIKAAGEGGTNDEVNLMSLCTSCHSHLHADRGDRWNVKR